MVVYECERCHKKFNHKGNYNAHINRKNEVLLYFRSFGVKKYIKVANAKVLAACAEKNP